MADRRLQVFHAVARHFSFTKRILALSAELYTRLKEMSAQVAGPLLVGASTTGRREGIH